MQLIDIPLIRIFLNSQVYSNFQIMDESTTNAVRMARVCESMWTQSLLFPLGKTKIDLSVAIGTKAIMPTSATNQPKMFPSNSRYLFDPSIYTGLGALEQLSSNLKSACPGCVLYPCRGEAILYTTFTFRCSHYYVQKDVKEFTPGYYSALLRDRKCTMRIVHF